MEGGERRVQLLCPSLPKSVQLIVDDDQRVDIGSIAAAFGLDPNSVKLNGYFISRGGDLVASSLTWRSLIGFFSARGLPAGGAASAPVIVRGKLSKIGSKRSHENTREMCFRRDSKRPQHEHVPGQADSQGENGLCMKREWPLEDERSSKRTRSDEASWGESKSGPLKMGQFSCSMISKNLKRMRIDEIVAAPPLKKLR